MKTGVYKTVYADLWEQDWFLDMTAEEKIVFLNIMTSRYNRQIGVYLPVIRFQAMQCGITKEQFSAIVDGFVERSILLRSTTTGEIAIPSYLIEHFGKGGEPAMNLLNNEAGSVKDQDFLQKILQENLEEIQARKDLSVNKTLLDFLSGYQTSFKEALNHTPDIGIDDKCGENIGTELVTVPHMKDDRDVSKPVSFVRHASETSAFRTNTRSADKTDTGGNEPTIYSIFQGGKYADKGKSYLDIARDDPNYARWWTEKKDVHNTRIRELFRLALLEAEDEQPVQDYQIERFREEYPNSYQNETAIKEMSRMTCGEAEGMLSFLWGCNDINWSFVEDIPEADYFVAHWKELRDEGLRNGYSFDNYLPF